MLHIDAESYLPFMIFSIPIVAIVGGITVAVVKAIGRQRLVELAQQERIAALQRGVDISKLPALPNLALDDDDLSMLGVSGPERDRRRAQGLMIGGIITLFAGIGIMAFLLILGPDGDKAAWAVGIIPGAVGLALLLSAWIVSPKAGATAGPTQTR
ncbi:MAG TPA: hypothetical protein VGK93_01495 [Candidatus Eisenbacteria bacterium]|jgi:hypothetical protein